MSYPDARALVTGGSSGIGAATAARSRCFSTGAVYDTSGGRATY
jgi:NAD(P)-dependent dehydrogenase (short-subunit alcohol dehydrogenase family)